MAESNSLNGDLDSVLALIEDNQQFQQPQQMPQMPQTPQYQSVPMVEPPKMTNESAYKLSQDNFVDNNKYSDFNTTPRGWGRNSFGMLIDIK